MKRPILIASVLGLLLLMTGVAYAQATGYSLPWWTTGGGGGESAGGNYRLAGIIPQQTMNALAGGNYRLESGFWSGISSGRCLSNPCQTYLPAVTNLYAAFFAGPWEVEDNDNAAQANGPLIRGSTYSGYHDDRDDYYRFMVTQNQSVTIRLVSTYTEASGHLQLQLLDNLLNVIDYRWEPTASITRTLAPGAYYIRIFTDPGYINASKSYTISESDQ
jgi:hypothetical protein